MKELVLYMKPSCHLCHDATALLERLKVEFEFTLREVDITQDAALFEAYGELIPVVEIDGKPLLAAPFGEAVARRALQQIVERAL